MRYIVVFAKQEISYAVAFEDSSDAIDFLFWGYEEYELLPYGIFDMLTGDIIPYQHRGERTADIEEPAIRRIALDYIKSAMRQTGTKASRKELNN